jgi:hypothetical protein
MTRLILILALVPVLTAQSFNGCDINGDGQTNVQDVQLLIDRVLGITPLPADLNGDGHTDVVDVQIAINAVLTGICTAKPPLTSIIIPLNTTWHVEHYNIPDTVPTLANGAISFPIQQYGIEWNNYFDIRLPSTVDVSKASTFTMAFKITTAGQSTWRYDSNPNNTCISPAKVRPYFAVSENDPRYNDTGRWWSNPIAFELDTLPANANQTVTLTIPLTPDAWSDVNGEFGNLNANTTSQFAATKLKVAELGLTFGGGCFFGHGVSVQGGTAKFELDSYQYN